MDDKNHKRKVERVKALLAALPVEDQRAIFLELGRCGCTDIARAAVKSPGAVIGAVIGGFIGAVIGSETENKVQTKALTRSGA